MVTSIKSVSTENIQDAIAKVLSEFTESNCTVQISELRFDASTFEAIAGGESMSFTAKASFKRKQEPGEVPF